jgi:hypothetical protein
MEGDDGQPPAGLQQRLGAGEAAVELAELVVHGDAQRLEAARRRIDGVALLRAEDAADDSGKLAGAGDRALGAAADDGAGDRSGALLLAIAEEDVGELRLVQLVDQIGRARALAAHAHVERPVARKEKPRSASSSCMEETPRSSATPSADATPLAARRSSISPKRPSTRVNLPAKLSARGAPSAMARGSRSRPTTRQSADSRMARL